MKLLFDNNLSPKLVESIVDIFPKSSHVALFGLEHASDLDVWTFAHKHNYTLVSKDSDFNDLVTSKGFPPKVIWVRIGNCTTTDVLQAIRNNSTAISQFGEDDTVGLLEIL